MAVLINPNKLLAHAIPNLWNIGLTNSGNTAAKIERKKVLAAMAEAEYFWKVSMR